MSYTAFLNKVQRKGSHAYHITHCKGARDAWKWVRKNKWISLHGTPCSSSTYGAVIKEMHRELAELLLEGHHVDFPYQMGTLLLMGIPQKVEYKGDKLKTTYPADWKKTLQHWYSDPEAHSSKQVVKRVIPYFYYLKYSKRTASYKNMRYYQFRFSRSLVRTLMKKTENEKLNALIY